MMVEMDRNTYQLLYEQSLQFSFLPYFFNICKNKGLIKNNLDEKIIKNNEEGGGIIRCLNQNVRKNENGRFENRTKILMEK
jgi:hypothetical protein